MVDVEDKEQDSWVEELSSLLVKAETQPNDIEMLKRQLVLLDSLSMTEEYLEAADHLSSLIMLDTSVWTAYFDKVLSTDVSLEGFISILERFSHAENDHLSLDLLVRHAELVIQTAEADVESELQEFLTIDNTRDLLQDIYRKSVGLVTGSSQVWTLWADWETQRLAQSTDRATQLQHLHQMYIERLSVPHLDIDATSSSYSSFCTEHSPNEYEKHMIAATAASQICKTKMSGEKRYGATREDYEQQLAVLGDPASRLATFVAYIGWETDPKARVGARDGPIADHGLCRAVFERTLAAYSSAYSTESQTESRVYYQDGEGSVWTRYIEWAKSVGLTQEVSSLARRATRACPGSAALWTTLLLSMELQEVGSQAIADSFETALSMGSLTDGSSTSFTDVFVTRAAQLARSPVVTGNGEGANAVIATVARGLQLLGEVVKAGDPALKLEKFVLEWAETKSPEHIDSALALLEKPLKSRLASYQMALLKANLETRRGNVEGARRVYISYIQRADLDWPEAIYEAFTQFELIHGSVATIDSALQRINKESVKVTRRREKMAQHAVAQQPAATASVSEAAPTIGREADALEPVTAQPEPALRTDESSVVKRDREHTTVMIGGLAKSTSKELVESLFESCGTIRETTILSDVGWPTNVALLEFQSVSAVSAALAKDRRKLDNQEIAVSMLWRSTLFVTNFSRELDDVAIRKLFGNYGTILQTRWPSRKYADSRRFCYITMDSPAAAENARVLDGFKPDPDARYGMKVLISDPAAKAKRTDAQDAVLFVGGLHARTTEQDVTELIQVHGTIKTVKLGWDPVKGVCKGFAFVTMSSEADATKALALHGTSYRGRLLKVEMNDPNFANKKVASDAALKEKRARTVRLNDLPEGVQEALLQQALEKVVPVRRLELFTKTRHALAELNSEADVGKLLLRTEPFIYNGTTVAITEHSRRPTVTSDATTQDKAGAGTAASTSSLSFAPRTAKRPGKVLGKRKHVQPKAAAGSNSAVVESSGNAQDAFRALVESKNKQRESNLATSRAKRSLEEQGSVDQDESKKPKTE